MLHLTCDTDDQGHDFFRIMDGDSLVKRITGEQEARGALSDMFDDEMLKRVRALQDAQAKFDAYWRGYCNSRKVDMDAFRHTQPVFQERLRKGVQEVGIHCLQSVAQTFFADCRSDSVFQMLMRFVATWKHVAQEYEATFVGVHGYSIGRARQLADGCAMMPLQFLEVVSKTPTKDLWLRAMAHAPHGLSAWMTHHVADAEDFVSTHELLFEAAKPAYLKLMHRE